MNSKTATLRRSGEFLLIVSMVLVVQYIAASYAKNFMGLSSEKIAESILSTFSSALTLLLSAWVAYRIAHSKQQQDNVARRKENVMGFYNSMSSPEFVAIRRHARGIAKNFQSDKSQSFLEFHNELTSQDRACLSSLLLLFRKLQLGLDNSYFEQSGVNDCFGDEIVIWHDGCLNEMLKGVMWPSVQSMRYLYKAVRASAKQEQLDQWDFEALEMKNSFAPLSDSSNETSTAQKHI